MKLVGALPRPRIPLAVAVLLAVLVTLLPTAPAAAEADPGTEAAFVTATNQARAAEGLAPLSVASDLTAVARSHTATMAHATELHHNPNLGSDVSGWEKVGENVGRGPSVTSIQDAFMASPGHRRNVLDGAWSQIGIGVVVEDGTIWVAVLFRQPSDAAAPQPPPAPAAPEPAGPEPAAEPVSEDPDGTEAAEPEPAAATSVPDAGDAPAPPAPDPTTAPPPQLDRIAVTMAKLAASER